MPVYLMHDQIIDYFWVAFGKSKMAFGAPGEAPCRHPPIFGHRSSLRAVKLDLPGDWLAYLHLKQLRKYLDCFLH